MAKYVLASLIGAASAEVTVMVFGDSFGDYGPKWNTVQDMFDQHGVAATVKNAAIGGTTACQWAGEKEGMQLVNKAKDLFGDAGPGFVWYTLGGNDIWSDSQFQECQKTVKGKDVSDPAVQKCIIEFNTRIIKCHSTMFDNFFKVFPKARIMQAGYDIPCGNIFCMLSTNAAFAGNLCGTNGTCLNTMLHSWNTNHLDRMQAKYKAPAYTAIKLIGAVQMADGVSGAGYNKPVYNKGANCAYEALCIHPKYNTPHAKAWGDGMWSLFFSKQGLNTSQISIVV